MSHAWLALVLSGWLCWGTSHAEGGQSTAGSTAVSASGLFHFDIGEQPLGVAVKAFSDITGQSLLVDERLLAGRVSPGVRGEFTAAAALHRLLAGSGLRERYASDQSFTLEPLDERAGTRAGSSAGEGDDAALQLYGASLQVSLEKALCRLPGAKPGSYRLALQVWIDGAGTVGQVQLLGSTGEQKRDGAIRSVLEGMHVDSPPAGVDQPMTLLLLPSARSRAAHCDTAAPAHG